MPKARLAGAGGSLTFWKSSLEISDPGAARRPSEDSSADLTDRTPGSGFHNAAGVPPWQNSGSKDGASGGYEIILLLKDSSCCVVFARLRARLLK